MSPERLRVETDPNNKVKRIYLDPKFFSLKALRIIARGQASSASPREITIITNQILNPNYKQSIGYYLPYSKLQTIKKLHKRERRFAIKDIAQKMYDADEIVIASPVTPF